MNVRELVASWQAGSAGTLTAREYPIRLPLRDVARIAALADLFPAHGEEALLRDLLGAALDVVEAELPSAAIGPIVSETDEGDPLFEPDGPAVCFRERFEHHLGALSAEAARRLAP